MNKKDYIIPLLSLLCIVGLLIYGPLSQAQSYHNFADQREALGIPNFLNVITNLPFSMISLMGFNIAKNLNEKRLKYISNSIFTGFLLLATGSGVLSLGPSNDTLLYDRVPIAVIVMSFFGFKATSTINVISIL